MPRSRAAALGLIVAVALLSASTAAARRKPKKPAPPDDGLPAVEQVLEQVRAVYADLATNSNPLVRRAVYNGQLELEAEDQAAAIARGLEESDWTIRVDALSRALGDKKDKKRRAAAEAMLAKLLESGEAEDRKHGMELLAAHAKGKDRIKALELAAKNGTPEARADARAALRAEGGAVAWKVIEAGLAEPAGEPEHVEAMKALATFRDPVAWKWLLGKVQDAGELGTLARKALIELDDKKAGAALDKELAKLYDKSAEFEERLRLGMVRAGRGQVTTVARTLLAGLKYREAWAKVMAWQGLTYSRDLAQLGSLRERILAQTEEAEADAAFGWMQAWAAQNAEPKVIELLQEGARSDRRPVRMRSMAVLTAIAHRPSVPLFEAAMNEGQTEVRLAGAKGLAAVSRAGDEARIAGYLRKEPENDVKLALIEALAHIGTPEIIDSLQFVLTSPNTEIKVAAANALAATATPKAGMLLGLLKRDPDMDVRFFAWHQLLRLKPETAKEFQLGALGWISGEQVETLGADPKIPVDLMAFVAEKGNDEQRMYAVAALAKRGAPAATSLLGLYENSPNAETAADALSALVAMRGAESLPTYRKAAEHKMAEVRAVGLDALGQFGSRPLLEGLLRALADKDPLARAQAARAAWRVAPRVVEEGN
ncbi:MAG: HEAT repeat domain-containing protein [Myxococcales bacterium]|nr:HEAT repeat domain-containing protein [Myxococcales bacterium]